MRGRRLREEFVFLERFVETCSLFDMADQTWPTPMSPVAFGPTVIPMSPTAEGTQPASAELECRVAMLEQQEFL